MYTNKLDRHWQIAKIAYNAYAEEVEWKALNGDPLPAWENLPVELAKGWLVAAEQMEIYVLTNLSKAIKDLNSES